MGLGKTAQTVCFVNHLYRVENDAGPFLVRQRVILCLERFVSWQAGMSLHALCSFVAMRYYLVPVVLSPRACSHSALLAVTFHFTQIIAPLSTLPHWKREFDTWTRFNTVLYHDVGGRVRANVSPTGCLHAFTCLFFLLVPAGP